MATLGTLTGTFLEPGWSKNRRYYSERLIADSAADMNARLESGKPISMMACHDTTSTLDQVATIRKVWTDESGRGRYTADIPDTRAGRDLAALTTPDPVTGERHLNSVSIYGGWQGEVRTVEVDGKTGTTGDKLLITRVDFVDDPGVEGARLDAQHAPAPGEAELIESLGDSFTPLTEGAPPATAMFHDAVVTEAPTNPPSKRDSGTSGPGGVKYADPGYQSDGVQRYELDTEAHIRAAWSFINKASNASKYTATQVTAIKSRIKKAANAKGIDITSESAAPLDRVVLTERAENLIEAVAAFEAMISVSAMQGPADVDVRAFGIDNADVAAAAALIGQAAANALTTLDPDQDDDLDLPGESDDADPATAAAADASGDDDPVDVLCAACMGTVPADASYCPACGATLGTEGATTRRGQEVAESVEETVMPENAPGETAELGPTKCGGCGGDVPADAKFCPNCGANTKTKSESGDTESAPTSEEAPVAETPNGDAVNALAEQLLAVMTAKTAESAPAATPAETPAPAAAEAAPAAPVSEKSVADLVAEAVKAEREAAAAAQTEHDAALVKGIGEAMAKGFEAFRDEVRTEITGSGQAGRRVGYGSSAAERIAALPEADDKPLHSLDPKAREKAHQEYIAAQMVASGIYSPEFAEAVKTQNRFSA